MAQWRDRTTSTFDCEKTSVSASRGMAVTNHPLASAAALEMMAQGGNAVDATVAALLYRLLCQQRVSGTTGIGLHPRSEITKVLAAIEGIEIRTVDKFDGRDHRSCYDAVILATGYDRETPHAFLEPIRRYIQNDGVDRNYRLATSPVFQPQIHLQGYSEASHGLSDTLLSVLATRAQEIAESLLLTIARRELIA